MQFKSITAITVLSFVVASLLGAGCTTEIPEPISEPLNTTMTTASASATPSASASASASATPKPNASGPTLSQDWLVYLTSYMEGRGYTVTEPIEYDYKVAGIGNSMYEAELTRNGVEFKCTLEPCKNLNEARVELTSSVSSLQRMGFAGTYENANTWTGTIIDDGAVLTGGTWFDPTWSLPVVITVFPD